jgi:two-component system, LytTR family, response regulator
MPDFRAVIVDDEPLARRGVRQLLAAHPDIAVIGECRDGLEALEALVALSPDLIFLDIQMPGVDGLTVIRRHGVERMPAVILVTAHDEFAIQAFEAEALDYLVKPVSSARFDRALARVRERLRVRDLAASAARLQALLARSGGGPAVGAAPAEPPRSRPRIPVTTVSGRLLLDPEDIEWIEAEDYYVGVHAGGTRYRIRESLATLESHLDPAGFVRVHRSAIVRLAEIRELRLAGPPIGELAVVLRDGTTLPVSRRRLRYLRARLREQILGS